MEGRSSREHQCELGSLIKSKKFTEQKLKTLKINQISKQKQRSHRKRQLEDLKINNVPAAKKLKLQGELLVNKEILLMYYFYLS